MYHVILEAILCLDYSQAHNTGTEYRSGYLHQQARCGITFSYQSSDTSDLNINVASFSRPRFKTSGFAAGLLVLLVLETLSNSRFSRSNAAASRT